MNRPHVVARAAVQVRDQPSGKQRQLPRRYGRDDPRAAAAKALFFCGLIAYAGLRASQGSAGSFYLLLALCLSIPILDRPHALRRSLQLGRGGWIPALCLGVGALLMSTFLLLAVQRWLGGPPLPIEPGSMLAFLLREARWLLPLALAEEFFFRGYLQQSLFAKPWGARAIWGFSRANWASALLFCLAHLVAQLQFTRLATLPAGLLFGWLTERAGGRIGPSILLHLLLNVAVAWSVWLWSFSLPWLPF